MGRALAELKKRLNHRWLQENRPDLDNQKDSRQESLEQDRIQEKYAADEEYTEARELGCPICSHTLTTVSASAECPMCEVLWHYHQDDGFSYFEAEYYEEEFEDKWASETEVACSWCKKPSSKLRDVEYGGIGSICPTCHYSYRKLGYNPHRPQHPFKKKAESEERGCYECPVCEKEMSSRNSSGFGNYCYCNDCQEYFITKPRAMMAAEEEMTYESMMGMVENLSDDDYYEFCYEMDIESEDMEELSSFIMRNHNSAKVIGYLQELDFTEDFEAVAVYQGKKPEGSVAKALLQKKLMDKAELLDTIHKLENDVRLGLISEEEIMKQLKEKFGAEGYDNFDAEFCSECGCSHKDAEEFAAETSSGNQVFNSCWKCGSGQHLYQIARYPATPSEISGVGGNPDEASEGGKQRAGN